MDSIVHFEIPATDRKRAATFYQTTFGWKLNEMPGMDYTTVETGPSAPMKGPTEPGYINGGIGPKKGVLTHPVVTVDVDDIEQALAKITKNGGKVVQRKEKVGDMGFTGYFQDTEGNTIGLWESAGSR